MFIDDYMTRDLVTVMDSAPVSRAQKLLATHRIHQVPVTDDGQRLVGIVTDRDVRSAVGYDNSIGERLRVSEIMTADPVTIPADASLEEALTVLCSNRFGALPVMDGDRMVGIITRHDVLRAFHKVLGLDRSAARVEIALPNLREDLADAFNALRACEGDVISAIVSPMRRDGGEPMLYLRVADAARRDIERHLRHAGLIVLAPEST